MPHTWTATDILTLLAAALLAVEATLAGFAVINARYRAADTVAARSLRVRVSLGQGSPASLKS
jgi:hypothetical protein